MVTFLGIDLGWYGKPTGLASMVLMEDGQLRLRTVTRLEEVNDIVHWVDAETDTESAVAAVDAPLVITNESGIRPAERALNRDFRRFHAGCHPANLSRPFAAKVIAFRERLEALGFVHAPLGQPHGTGRVQIEVFPHAAAVSLFGLDRIVKYKKGNRAERAKELRRLRGLLAAHLPEADPPVALPFKLPSIPRTGNLKSAEDQIDAILCAYVGAYWWHWGAGRNSLYGDGETGCIVVPRPR